MCNAPAGCRPRGMEEHRELPRRKPNWRLQATTMKTPTNGRPKANMVRHQRAQRKGRRSRSQEQSPYVPARSKPSRIARLSTDTDSSSPPILTGPSIVHWYRARSYRGPADRRHQSNRVAACRGARGQRRSRFHRKPGRGNCRRGGEPADHPAHGSCRAGIRRVVNGGG